MADESDTCAIGVLYGGSPLILRQAGNGGWIVETHMYPGRETELVGAYSNAADMIAALSHALCHTTDETTPTNHTGGQ